jgi:hypothetical protein
MATAVAILAVTLLVALLVIDRLSRYLVESTDRRRQGGGPCDY